MADDSWDIDENIDFHPCDTPHGMKNYILTDLTPEQQIKLNERKRDEIRKNQEYMRAHPEIRGIIVMLLRLLLRKRPKFKNIYETVGQYFTKSSVDIQEEVYDYLRERDKVLSKNSFVASKEESLSASFMSLISSEELSLEEEVAEEELMEKSEEMKSAVIEEEIIPQKTVEEITRSKQVHAICAAMIEEIIDAVIEEIDLPSLGSIASASGFPVDYDDHAIDSNESISGDDDFDDD